MLGHAQGVLLADVRQSYREEFAWLAEMTGPTRDLDVYILEWDRYVGELTAEHKGQLESVLLHLRLHRARALNELVTALQSDRAKKLIASWRLTLRQLEAGSEIAPKAHKPLPRVVSARIRDAHQALLDNGRAITASSPAEALHDLRKDAKKLRYAVECFGGLLPDAERKAFVRQLKELQDNLGEHQDAEVHSAELNAVARELAGPNSGPDIGPDAGPDTLPDTLMALGALTEHLELGKRAARSEFAQRFADFDSKKTRTILAKLLDPKSTK